MVLFEKYFLFFMQWNAYVNLNLCPIVTWIEEGCKLAGPAVCNLYNWGSHIFEIRAFDMVCPTWDVIYLVLLN